MNTFAYLTPATYLLLILLWSVVAVFYYRRRQRAKREGALLLNTLLLVLLLDAGRTIFESAYFGAWFSAKLGFLPLWLYDFLVMPQIVFIPKAINLAVGVAVMLIILRRWLPQEEKERVAQRARETLLEETVLARTKSLRETNRRLEADIAQRIAAEARLSRSQKDLEEARSSFETLLESIPDALVLTDTDRRITAVNRGFTTLFGYTAEDVIGKPTSLFYESQEEFERQGRLRYNLSAERKGLPYTVTYRCKDGTLLLGETTGTSVVSPSGEALGFFGLIRDIRERLRQEERLRQTQKLEALGTLSGGIAHDFNNILAAILGFASLLEERAPEGSEDRSDIAEILQAAHRAKELVNQILTFSREEVTTREIVRLDEVVEEVMRLLRQTLPSTIGIVLELDSERGTVLADPTQMHQICLNLCTNAHHAMRETGGTLKVSLEALEIDEQRAEELPGLSTGPHLRLSIEDTGTGMEAHVLEKIYEPFFTTKPLGDGTGMGLAMVHGIVIGHEGAIEVESRPGEGTCFRIFLPRTFEETQVPEGARETQATEPERRPSKNGRILVVDDEPALTRMLERVFRRLGHDVECTNSSVEALERIRQDPWAFDLVFTDQTMPQLSGAELTREVLALRPEMPVILCTGYSDTLDETRAAEIGAKALLAKPLDIPALKRVLQEVLNDEQYRAGREK